MYGVYVFDMIIARQAWRQTSMYLAANMHALHAFGGESARISWIWR
jgi:hypothetical protein